MKDVYFNIQKKLEILILNISNYQIVLLIFQIKTWLILEIFLLLWLSKLFFDLSTMINSIENRSPSRLSSCRIHVIYSETKE